MDDPLTIIHGTDDDKIARACAIRETVFIHEQNVAPEEEWDDLDHQTIHFLVIDPQTGEDIATGRLMLQKHLAKLQRIAVLKHARGRSIGFRLIEEMLEHSRNESGITEAMLGAQCYAIPFYEKLGFSAYGDIYDDAGIPHRDMKRDL